MKTLGGRTAVMEEDQEQEAGIEENDSSYNFDHSDDDDPHSEKDESDETHVFEPPPSSEQEVVRYDLLHHYLIEIRKYPYLSREEEMRLALLSKSTDEEALQAITNLVLSHLRLVAAIAMEYRNLPLDTMDLIQEGNMGLMQAIQKFDPYRNIRVSTYATWWIRAYILKYIIQNWRLVKIGTTESQRKLFFNLSKERERLEKLGCVATPKLLADRLHVKEEDVIDVEQRLLPGHEISLYSPVGDADSETTLIETIPSEEEGIEETVSKAQIMRLFQSKLAAFSKTLNARDQDILSSRILSEQPMTLDELGAKYNISKERVRQLEEKLIKKLRTLAGRRE
ncbi:MAG: RNA polymerase factor sigma-32 [Nitrospirota bacterium]